MRRTLLLAALLLGMAAPLSAQPLTLDLAVPAGGTSADTGEGVAIAPDGSYYVAGTFEGTATFGEHQITVAGNSDVFLVKYDSEGNALWARRAGTDEWWDYGRDVAVDAEGNAYLAGNFTGVATWDGGNNPDIELTTRNDWDGFVAKYTPEGDLEWVQQLGGAGQDAANAVAVSPDGTVYVGGGFVGPGIFGDITLPGAGSTDGYIAALDPEDGDVLWAKSAGGSQNDTIYGVATDAEGNVYVAGQYNGVATIFDTPYQSNGLTDVFAAKLSPEGEPLWTLSFGGAGNDYARGIGVSPDGFAVLTGSFEEDVLVGQDVLVSAGASDVLVAGISPEGTLAWGRRAGGDGFDFSASAAMDAEGRAYVTGYVVGTGTFGEEPYTTAGFDDVFLAVYDREGELLHTELFGGTNRDEGKGIDVAGGRFALTGYFRGTANFGGFELESAGSLDVFLAAGEALEVEEDLPPVAELSETDVEISLITGETATESVTLSNTAEPGALDLTFEASVAAARPRSTRLVEPGTTAPAPSLGATSLARADGSTDARAYTEITGAPFAYLRGGEEVTITHSASQTITQFHGVACADDDFAFTTENSYWRVFDLADFPEVAGGLSVTAVEVGVESADGPSLGTTVRLYTLDGPLQTGNLTQVGEATSTIPSGTTLETVTVPVEGELAGTDVLVVEWFIEDGEPTLSLVFPGTNALGETGPTYISSASCEIDEPVTMSAIGFPNVHLVMNVHGTTGGAPMLLAVSPESGTLAPGESEEITLTANAEGVTPGSYDFLVTFATNDPENPTLELEVTVNVGGVATEDGAMPIAFALSPNYPNPFAGRTTIEYALPEATSVKLSVFDAAGRLVATLVDGEREAGFHTVEWSAEGLASGVYFARIEAGPYRGTQRMVLVQ